jgi:2-methylisocitrate lyase-like PEP mutase family enzyme
MRGLADRLGAAEALLAPGVYDALSALVAAKAGAEALYLSGASLAYARFGRPDIGLVTMSELADHVAAIRDRVETPLIVDADTGFGNALNVQRTVRILERMGADAVQIEDQASPKRCGHLDGKTLIPPGEMAGKLRAALDARRRESTLLIARTDAVAVEGLDAALDRAELYAEAGADLLFVEAPRNEAEMRAVVERLGDRAPLVANMVEGGRTPARSAADLSALGFSLVLFPGGAVRAVARAAEAYYASLLANGANAPFADRMHDLASLNALLGTPELIALGRRYEDPGT